MKNIKQLVSAPTGLRWLEEAGRWADEEIRACPRYDERDFVVWEIKMKNCVIDPRKIVGTSHGAYNQGMTWREFLAYGKRMKKKLDMLETKPEYYDDPKAHATDTEPWSLVEINGELFTDTGNHRSVVAKFRAHEEGRIEQRVWSVDRLIISETAKLQYEELQSEYLPCECDRGLEREMIYLSDSTKRYRIFVNCILHGMNCRVHRLPLDEAAEYVRKRNRSSRVALKIAPQLWNRMFGVHCRRV
ncbi:hypothetical protein [Ruegeria arenilitoris]|uniref:hypothetical protein n=1 Tax=Ruegeria arenilitoris TaxID=1173585 RepID=UPI00147E6B42|nr:hypothetical protein [Ruegeria arenilitoris]